MRDTLEENVMVSKLIEKIQKTKAPICVGLDPMLGYIPEHVKEKHCGVRRDPGRSGRGDLAV